MERRLAGAPGVNIPRSASNGWSTSWKKFMIELAYLRGSVVLYPSFFNQSSLSTNHLEKGEHVGGKANKLRHLPIDFTVPLIHELDEFRLLWAPNPRSKDLVSVLPALVQLPVLDLFSRRSSLERLRADGFQALGSHRSLVVQHDAGLAAKRRDAVGGAAGTDGAMGFLAYVSSLASFHDVGGGAGV